MHLLVCAVAREWITVDEDDNMVLPEASEQKAAELGTKFERWLLAQTDLNPGEEAWLRMVGSQIRADTDTDTWTAPGAEFTAEHFAFHPFSQLGGMAQAVGVFESEGRMVELLESLNARVLGGKAEGAAKREGEDAQQLGVQ